MDLQNAFYLFALILMSLSIMFILGCIAFLTYLFITFKGAKKQLGETVDRLTETASKSSGITGMGMFLIRSILRKLKDTSPKE